MHRLCKHRFSKWKPSKARDLVTRSGAAKGEMIWFCNRAWADCYIWEMGCRCKPCAAESWGWVQSSVLLLQLSCWLSASTDQLERSLMRISTPQSIRLHALLYGAWCGAASQGLCWEEQCFPWGHCALSYTALAQAAQENHSPACPCSASLFVSLQAWTSYLFPTDGQVSTVLMGMWHAPLLH